MLRIGLTGGIGSGKSTVARIFEQLGIPVFYADREAKRIMEQDPAMKAAICACFGQESYAGGQLNRSFLATNVFNDPAKLEQLNRLVHPATIQATAAWMQKQDAPYAIKEAALLFESGSQQWLDYVIGVSAPLNIRLQRTMKRDQVTSAQVLSRMQYQIDETIKMKLCDFIIHNDDQEAILPQVLNLHERLLTLAQTSTHGDAIAH